MKRKHKLGDPLISIVIPAFNEARGIQAAIGTVDEIVANEFEGYEILVVDDGSKDDTCEKIRELACKNPSIKLIKLTKNFGKEAALVAGLRKSRGQVVVVLDSDLQHPPSLILDMYQIWKTRGVKVVNGVKKERQQEGFFKRVSAASFYALMKTLTGSDLKNQTDFKLMDREVVDRYVELPENRRFFRGLIPWLGYSSENVYFSPDQRNAGTTGWSLPGLAKMGIMAICSFSSLPMQGVTLLGCATFLASIVMGIHTIGMKLTGQAVEGFATVILLLLFVGSVIMISLGIIGQYISMIYHEVKRRPGYLIEQTVNIDETE
ncbi:MAG: glycosyltransferase family 2 protein [Desulfobacterium sp.]|nr:glycosyltransferase family 2 protein [Desulfobacterium sp.]